MQSTFTSRIRRPSCAEKRKNKAHFPRRVTCPPGACPTGGCLAERWLGDGACGRRLCAERQDAERTRGQRTARPPTGCHDTTGWEQAVRRGDRRTTAEGTVARGRGFLRGEHFQMQEASIRWGQDGGCLPHRTPETRRQSQGLRRGRPPSRRWRGENGQEQAEVGRPRASAAGRRHWAASSLPYF